MKIVAASYLWPVSSPPIEGGALVMDQGRIVALGRLCHIKHQYSLPVEDYPGCVIMPGFVNAHCHLELTHFPSWKIRKGIDYAPRTFVDWVIQVIKINRGLTQRERELSLQEGIRISLESGTTSIGDIVSGVLFMQAYSGSAITARVYLEALGQEPMRCKALLEKLRSQLRVFNESPVLPGLSPHAPYTMSDALIGEVADLAVEKQVPIAIHISESREEMEFLSDSTGKIADLLYPHVGWEEYIPRPRKATPVEHLDALGVLRHAPTAVHCVHLNASDVEILKKRGVRVVLCPRSNDKLDVGKAPAYILKKAGVPLALGTDSLASNDSLSMQDEMNFAMATYQGVFTPAEILRMATLGGAEALRIEQDAGSLEVGKKADFLVMEVNGVASPDDLPRAILEEGKIQEVAAGGAFLTFPPPCS